MAQPNYLKFLLEVCTRSNTLIILGFMVNYLSLHQYKYTQTKILKKIREMNFINNINICSIKKPNMLILNNIHI